VKQLNWNKVNSGNINPPKLPLRFFRWYCHPKLLKYIEGDLMELYEERAKEKGKRKADIKFIMDVLLLFRPGIIRPAEGHQSLNTYGMYKSYFKIGWRNLLRNKGYSFINIGGLAIGMTVAILNGLWIWDEFSFNKYFANYNRIAQVSELGIDTERGGQWLNTTMTYPLWSELKTGYKQHFKRIVRTPWGAFDFILTSKDQMLSAQGLYADEGAPELFAFKMIHGSRAGLSTPQSVLIDESTATALFGSDDPINKMIRLNNSTDVTVAGVYEDFPKNTHFDGVNFFAPWSLYLSQNKWIEQRAMADWRNHFIKIYVELPEENLFESTAAQIKQALQFDPQDKEQATKRKQELGLYPMSQWHLYPSGGRGGVNESIQMIKLVGAIGVFVLLLACINFMNLSTARSEKRAKEVGVRKTIGSVRSQLIHQFFSESFLVVFFAFFLAILLTSLSLPWFNDIASKQIVMPWTNGLFWLSGIGFVILTSVLAGSYPALYLSSFNPIKALKGTFRMGPLAAMPRKVLVVVQFSISVILIIGTAIVYQQIQFAKNRPVGYDREGLIMIKKKTADFTGKYELLRNELKNTGVVFEVSESMGPVTEVYSGNNGWDWEGRNPDSDESFATLAVSHTHGKTVGWQFIDGSDFDLSMVNDSSGLVINESAAEFMGLKNPVGEPVRWTWWADKSRVMNYKIIGVIKDMVMDSPYKPTEPTMFYLKGLNGKPGWMNIKVNPQVSVNEALLKIESVFKKIIPAVPFDYKFADVEYATKFANEERIGKLASIFAGLAVFISCLGLLGLASFVAEQRTKEIGIRKVLGASVANLWRMLSRDFVVLVIISCLVAAPLAYYFLHDWLQKFEYRTDISLWIFLSTGVGAIIITLLTVSFQAIKAALSNPVKSLRSE